MFLRRYLVTVPMLGLGLSGLMLAAAPAGRAAPTDSQAAVYADPRLQKRITLRLAKRPLSRVLSEIGAKADVRLSAATDVADEPAVVYVTQQRAGEVMRHLAQLFNFHWARTGKEPDHGYELFQDLRSKQEEEALRNAGHQKALTALHAAIRQRVAMTRSRPEELLRLADTYDDEAREVRKLAPAERQALLARPEYALMDRLKETQPVREMAGEHWRILAQMAARLSEEHWRALVNGQTLRFSSRDEPGFARLPHPLDQALAKARVSFMIPGQRLNFGQADGPMIYQRMHQFTVDQWARAEARRVRVRLEVPKRGGNPEATLKLQPSTVMPADFGGEQHMAPRGLEVSSRETGAASDAPAPVEEAPADPVLEAKRVWNAPRFRSDVDDTVNWAADALPQIAETYEVDVVADAYRHPEISMGSVRDGAEASLRDVLDAYVTPVSRWTWYPRRAPVPRPLIRVRRRAWYFDRVAEVPDRVTERWAAHLRRKPMLTAPDLGSIVLALRDEQVPNLRAALAEKGVLLDSMYRLAMEQNRDFLRAYGSLTSAQRDHLRGGGQIPEAAMPPAARHWLRVWEAYEHRDRDEPPAPAPGRVLRMPPLTVVVSRMGEEASVAYTSPEEPGRQLGSGLLSGGAALLPPEELTREVMFEYGIPKRSLRYFWVFPLGATLRPDPPEPEKRAAPAPRAAPKPAL